MALTNDGRRIVIDQDDNEHSVRSTSECVFRATVDGCRAAAGTVALLENRRWAFVMLQTESSWRKKGIASAIYAHVQMTGREMAISADRHPDGEAFWRAMNPDLLDELRKEQGRGGRTADLQTYPPGRRFLCLAGLPNAEFASIIQEALVELDRHSQLLARPD